MPFDGPGLSGNPTNSRLPKYRRAANALAWIWPHGRIARGLANRSLQSSMEAAAVPELLCAARALISSEETWVQGRLRTRNEKFCAMGAILHVSAVGRGQRFTKPAVAHLLAVAKQRGFPTIERMNNSSTHADVLAAFDEAIRLSEARRDPVT